ncbi:hypothetical protein ACFCYB_15440 [Streptomyces sp. NPDC056309]|uniref:hypothetical protein n=1 Tax=unclassified Streptomyces TaxID=2593676 RepID=UPI0035D91E64
MRHVDPALLARYADSGAPALPWKTAEQGAATSVLLAVSPHTEGVTGQYFEDCQKAEPLHPDNLHGGVADDAFDGADATRLWELSMKTTTRS